MEIVKISVVISTFNTDEYISECLTSIFKQTLKEIEIIIIDDGSTDNTREIIEEFLKDHDNLIYIFQDNTGPGIARNRGIELAKGEFLAFMDPDDLYPNDDCLEVLYKTAKQNEVKMCGGSILTFDGDRNSTSGGEDFNINRITNALVSCRDVWNIYGHTRYIYDSVMVKDKGIKFAPYRRYEDQVFVIDSLFHAKYLYEVDYPVYKYRTGHKNDNYSREVLLDIFKGMRDTLVLLNTRGMEYAYKKTSSSIEKFFIREIIRNDYGDDEEIAIVRREVDNILTDGGKKQGTLSDKSMKEMLMTTHDQDKTIRSIAASDSVIIYGAGAYTERFLKKYGSLFHDNLIGIAVTASSREEMVEGVKVMSLNEYASYKDDVTILITTSERYQGEIIENLKRNGFKNYYPINGNLI